MWYKKEKRKKKQNGEMKLQILRKIYKYLNYQMWTQTNYNFFLNNEI